MTNTDTRTPASIAAGQWETVRQSLTGALAKATDLGTAHLVRLYGAGTDSASVKLATRAAAVLAGGGKPRGGAAQRINDTIKQAIAAVEGGSAIDPRTLATAARTVLDAHKEAEAARRAHDKAEREIHRAAYNNNKLAPADRIAAFAAMTEFDAVKQAEKVESVQERFKSAVIAARKAGLSRDQLFGLVGDVFAPRPAVTDQTPAVA